MQQVSADISFSWLVIVDTNDIFVTGNNSLLTLQLNGYYC